MIDFTVDISEQEAGNVAIINWNCPDKGLFSPFINGEIAKYHTSNGEKPIYDPSGTEGYYIQCWNAAGHLLAGTSPEFFIRRYKNVELTDWEDSAIKIVQIPNDYNTTCAPAPLPSKPHGKK